MSQNEFQLQYKTKTNLELLHIAMNYDDSYSSEAIDLASSVLRSRFDETVNVEQIWKEEIRRLLDLDARCSICGDSEVVYTKDFYLCTIDAPEDKNVAPGFIDIALLSPSRLGESYDAVKLEFKLCTQCLERRTSREWFGQKRVNISWQDYNEHPLCAFYKPLGYIDVR